MAPLVAQYERSLAGIGGEDDIAVDGLGDMARERGLAGAGIAEHAEKLRLAALQPARHGGQGHILLGRPAHRGTIVEKGMAQMGPSRAAKASATWRPGPARHGLPISEQQPSFAP